MRPQLSAAGYDVTFAVADLHVARQILGPGATLLQAPAWPYHRHDGARVQAASFADTLTLIGFGLPERLGAVVDGWLGLISLVSPDVMVADHSPGAQLAARLTGRRLITIGTGFTQPPLEGDSLPPLRVDIPPAQPEHVLLGSARQVLSERGDTDPPATLTRLLRSDHRLVIGLPEIDPYRSFRREALVAPTGGFAEPGDRASPALFAYLGAELPGLEEKIAILCDLDADVEIYVRDGGPLLTEFIRTRGKVAHDRPANTREVLSRTTHVVSQAGAMLASEAVAAGCAQLLLPLHSEPELNAALVNQIGAGRRTDPYAPMDAFRHELLSFIGDAALEARSRNIARLLSQRPLETADAALLRVLSA